VRPYACAIDANPYGFLANLANAAQVGPVATPELSHLDGALPVPMFRSTFRVRYGSADRLRARLDRDGPGAGPWWLGPSTTPARGRRGPRSV
jgi:hypothetical protein